MKRTSLFLAVACAATVALAADVFDSLVPAPRRVVRGTAGLAPSEMPATNGCFRVDVRKGRVSFEAVDRAGTNAARTVAANLRLLAGREALPDATIVDWPDTPHRGVTVDSREPGGDAAAMRQILLEAARRRLDAVVWRLEPGTNGVFAACSDRDYKAMARFGHKFGLVLVPSLAVGLESLKGREAAYLQAVAQLVPARGMPCVDLGAAPSEAWRAALAATGKSLLSEVPGVRLEPLPKSAAPDGRPYELPADVANRLWRGESK